MDPNQQPTSQDFQVPPPPSFQPPPPNFQDPNQMQPQHFQAPPPGYQPPPPPHGYHMQQQQVNNSIYQIPTMGNYIVVQLMAMIPIAGFIFMIMWAIGGNEVPIWKSNYARAYFIMMAIGVGIAILMWILLFGIIMAAVGMLAY